MGNGEAAYFWIWLIAGLLQALICGAITRAINRAKNRDGGFWWGFFLGVIGIIVVAVRPSEGATVVTRTIVVDRDGNKTVTEETVVTSQENDFDEACKEDCEPCPKCGWQLFEDDEVCSNCGYVLPAKPKTVEEEIEDEEEDDAEMRMCPRCGESIYAYEMTCSKCGCYLGIAPSMLGVATDEEQSEIGKNDCKKSYCFCPQCGKSISAKAKCCTYCGEKIDQQ